MRQRSMGEASVKTPGSVQSSAIGIREGGSRTHQTDMPATPVSRTAKRSAGVSTGQTSRKSAGGPAARSKACEPATDDGSSDAGFPAANFTSESTTVVVRDLRPKQVLAASLLVQGRQGKEVAQMVGVSPETISRWRQQAGFQSLMHRLLQETVDAAKLGLVSLCAESILHLRGLIQSFNDGTSLKAITLVLGKVGPVLGVISEEVRESPRERD